MIDGEMNQEFLKNLQDQVNQEQMTKKLNDLNKELEALEKQNAPTPEDQKTIIEFANTLDLENVKPNSVLVVKIGVHDPSYAHNVQMGIIHTVLEPRMVLLKEKKLTVLFMSSEDDVALLDESDMAKAGWVKKDKSFIINPYDK